MNSATIKGATVEYGVRACQLKPRELFDPYNAAVPTSAAASSKTGDPKEAH